MITSLMVAAGCRETPKAPARPADAPPPVEPAAVVSPPEIVKSPEHEPPRTGTMRTLFPFIRADIAGKVVEFDGIIPINCHDPVTPKVYLEVVACIPDTREHEALVMSRAKPSEIHAALLAIGLNPGAPGSWKFENKKLIAVPPRGDGLGVFIAYRDASGSEVECPAAEWIVNAETGAPFGPRDADAAPGAPRWLFAGSVMALREGREVYDADGAGMCIGLCTFGSEVIAWRDTISPEAAVHEPVWIADPKKVPALGTAVVVRIKPAHP